MALSGIQRTFADILDSIWGKDAQTSIPTQPVSGIAYRDTDAEFESGQKYDSLGESSRWNQMLYLLTGLMSELTAFGILPWSAAQPYSKGALCIGSNGALWQAQIDIVPNPTNPVVPGTDSSVWASPEIPGTVPDSRRVVAGTGLTGGGPLSADVTLAAKLTDSVSTTDSTTAASATAVKTAYDRGTAGITAAGTAQSAAATAQSTANNALSVANGKAPGGYGLGEQNGRSVHDANNALEAGWWTPDNNQNALNFYDLNHPLLVIARNVWGTAQVQFVSGKIAVRELSNSVWSEWSLAQVGYADNAGNAQKLAGLTPTLINSTDNSNWLLALGNGSDIVTRRPQDVSVSYSDVSGTAYDSKKISSIVVYTNTTRYITYPPGGTYVMVAQYNSNGCAVRDRTAGGTVVDMGNPVAVAIFIPV